jgi:hypothetical protein
MNLILNAFAFLRLKGFCSILNLPVEFDAQREILVSHHQRRSLRHIGYVLGQLAVVSSQLKTEQSVK